MKAIRKKKWEEEENCRLGRIRKGFMRMWHLNCQVGVGVREKPCERHQESTSEGAVRQGQ